MTVVRRKRTQSADLTQTSTTMTLVTLVEPLPTTENPIRRRTEPEIPETKKPEIKKRRRHKKKPFEEPSTSFWFKFFLIAAVLSAITSSGLLVFFWRNSVSLRDDHETWLKSVAKDIYEYYSKEGGRVGRHAFSLWPYHLHDVEYEPPEEERHHLWEPDPNFVAPRYRTSLQQANYFEEDVKDERPKPERAAEASAALRAAIEMSSVGKLPKAMRLFQHALALVNDDPEILIAYGEFLEKYENNYVEADHLYTRALVIAPLHSRAVANKRRTSPLVAELDFEVLKRIDSKRDELAKLPDSNAALRRIKKEAYFQYIYHTVGIEGNTMSLHETKELLTSVHQDFPLFDFQYVYHTVGIEGNTMTLSETRSVLETRLAVGGKSVMEHNEILGMDAALRFINQSLLHRIGAITVGDILDIHRKVMGMVDPDVAGVYRKSQVFVSKHIPPAADRVPSLMEDLVSWLNSPAALEAHPIHYAALAHYKLVYIHPFVDGNGRTARLFMNWILMQEGYPPVIIRKQDRAKYYETLQVTNDGDARPFMRFIADCAEKTLDVYLWATSEVQERAIQALPQERSLKDDFEEEEAQERVE